MARSRKSATPTRCASEENTPTRSASEGEPRKTPAIRVPRSRFGLVSARNACCRFLGTDHLLNGKTQQLFLAAAFVSAVACVGPIQAVIELKDGESPRALDVFTQRPTQPNLRAYEKRLEDASWFATRLRGPVQYLQYVVLDDTGPKALSGRDGWWFYRPGVTYLVEPWPPATTQTAPERQPDDPLAAIVDFRDRLSARGIHLVVVPVPGKASVYPDMLTRRAGRSKATLDGHTSQLLDQLENRGVLVVDLFTIFDHARRTQTADDPSHFYLAQDTHWSPPGMRLAARAVAEKIRELDCVDEACVDYDLTPVRVQRQGDVPAMMRVPAIENRIPREQVDCTQVVLRDSRQPYVDDPQSEILVLGDSFSRIYQQDAPGSGGFVAHLAHELGMPLASLVNDGGASTLVRQSLATKPQLLKGKRVVVWEFVERDIRFGLEGWQMVPLPGAP